jgi:hypothetical protein
VVSVISGQSAVSAREQQSEFVPSNPQTGETFLMEIDGYEYTYTAVSGDDVTDVSYGLAQAYALAPLPNIGCDYQGERVYCYGNNDTVSFSVYGQVYNPNPDTTAPQLTVEGQTFVGTQTGSMTIEAGEPFVTSASWIDNRNVTGGSVAGSGESLDTSATGAIVRTYTQTDNDGNTTTVTFTYTVRDTTAPGLELNGDSEIVQQIDDGQYDDEGANTYDTFDGDGYITGTIIEDDRSELGTGTYILEYVARDRSGNERSTQRSVTMIDTYGPSI